MDVSSDSSNGERLGRRRASDAPAPPTDSATSPSGINSAKSHTIILDGQEIVFSEIGQRPIDPKYAHNVGLLRPPTPTGGAKGGLAKFAAGGGKGGRDRPSTPDFDQAYMASETDGEKDQNGDMCGVGERAVGSPVLSRALQQREKSETTASMLRRHATEELADRREAAGPGILCPWLDDQTSGIAKGIDLLRTAQLEREKGVSTMSQNEMAAREKRRQERAQRKAEADARPPPLPHKANEYWEGRYVGREMESVEQDRLIRMVQDGAQSSEGGGVKAHAVKAQASNKQGKTKRPKRIEDYRTVMSSTDPAGKQLLRAVVKGDEDTVRSLIQDYGCDVNIQPQGSAGATAAHRLAATLVMQPPGAKVSMARLLISLGAQTGSARINDMGYSAFAIARHTMALLEVDDVKRRARLSKEEVAAEEEKEERDKRLGKPPPAKGVRCGLQGQALKRAAAEALECAHVLNPATTWRAALQGDVEHLEWLHRVQGCALVGEASRNPMPRRKEGGGAGFTPLHYAAMAGRVRACRFLLEQHGADPAFEALDARRTTAHHLAAAWLHQAEVRETELGYTESRQKSALKQKLNGNEAKEERAISRDKRCAYCRKKHLQASTRESDRELVGKRVAKGWCPACGKAPEESDYRKMSQGSASKVFMAAEQELRAMEEMQGKMDRWVEFARGQEDEDGATAITAFEARQLVELLLEHDRSSLPPPAHARHARRRWERERANAVAREKKAHAVGEAVRADARRVLEYARGTTAATAILLPAAAAEQASAATLRVLEAQAAHEAAADRARRLEQDAEGLGTQRAKAALIEMIGWTTGDTAAREARELARITAEQREAAEHAAAEAARCAAEAEAARTAHARWKERRRSLVACGEEMQRCVQERKEVVAATAALGRLLPRSPKAVKAAKAKAAKVTTAAEAAQAAQAAKAAQFAEANACKIAADANYAAVISGDTTAS
eukprot:g1820.t1